MRNSPRPLDVRVTGVLGTVLACLLAPASALSQEEPLDSAEVLESVRDLQEDFERFRESKIPVEMERVGGTCDERIGRICIWFGGEEEETFPAEFREVGQARVELIRQLTDAFEQIKDRWVIGQMVHYLVETRLEEMRKRARDLSRDGDKSDRNHEDGDDEDADDSKEESKS